MKKLLFTLLLSAQLLASNTTPLMMKCEMTLEMFNFSTNEAGKAVTKEQLIGVIEVCNGFKKYQQTVDNMKKLLLTL